MLKIKDTCYPDNIAFFVAFENTLINLVDLEDIFEYFQRIIETLNSLDVETNKGTFILVKEAIEKYLTNVFEKPFKVNLKDVYKLFDNLMDKLTNIYVDQPEEVEDEENLVDNIIDNLELIHSQISKSEKHNKRIKELTSLLEEELKKINKEKELNNDEV